MMYIPKDKKSYIERFRKIAKEYHRKKVDMIVKKDTESKQLTEQEVRRLLFKQMELLSEKSLSAKGNELTGYSNEMLKIAISLYPTSFRICNYTLQL